MSALDGRSNQPEHFLKPISLTQSKTLTLFNSIKAERSEEVAEQLESQTGSIKKRKEKKQKENKKEKKKKERVKKKKKKRCLKMQVLM